MKKIILLAFALATLVGNTMAQDIKTKDVPAAVKEALTQKYANATKVSWEKEKGNYEANWGRRSGEDTSVQFTPAGAFVEEANATQVSQLPATVSTYVKANYNDAKIKEAGKVTDAAGNQFFEAEIKGKDLVFDKNGKFVKANN